jgi:hypothetical protein
MILVESPPNFKPFNLNTPKHYHDNKTFYRAKVLFLTGINIPQAICITFSFFGYSFANIQVVILIRNSTIL